VLRLRDVVVRASQEATEPRRAIGETSGPGWRSRRAVRCLADDRADEPSRVSVPADALRPHGVDALARSGA